jgi:hypothetical protein
LNTNFIELIKNNNDSYVKFFNVCTQKYVLDDCVLGLFAIKCKYIKEFNYTCIKSAECEFASYVRRNVKDVIEIKQLNIECCFADDLKILIV